MAPDTIRLILIVVGALLLLGLYLWERGRDRAEEEDDEGYEDDDMPYAAGRTKREPELGRLNDPDLNEGQDEGDRHPRRGGQLREQPSGKAPTGARADGDSANGVPAPLLIQLSVAKRYGEFDGPDLLEVAESCGLRPGDMDIFHCLDEFDDGTRIYFSMANMVKPGTFPFDDMEGFSTPGLMLFAQLTGQPEDLTVLEEMIATARKLATTLGGDVFDDIRRPLTVRKEEAMRDAVLANEKRFLRAVRR
ncbi:cell division protein ZipA C-terminal FtsZ-binding domain-containing protein [uncultured Lamprocystis sp.]|jgi:cell division protein ZipA|uniref:cell division protein ZipA C-terminal FtsZ-binding domain-containing protein n=1 Tax=uncultured Lamprocystis sp. TaxID=543132 RepID=UPI0025DE5F58|nr:cell division protein ZipA C-terminal FtsZ-binding domain-containing protein [uncultured Lamprocystis sp.]